MRNLYEKVFPYKQVTRCRKTQKRTPETFRREKGYYNKIFQKTTNRKAKSC